MKSKSIIEKAEKLGLTGADRFTKFFRNVKRTKKAVDARSMLYPSDRYSKFLQNLKKK